MLVCLSLTRLELKHVARAAYRLVLDIRALLCEDQLNMARA